MVGDRMETDIISGLEAGMRTILVTTGSTRPEQIASFPYGLDPGRGVCCRPGAAGGVGRDLSSAVTRRRARP